MQNENGNGTELAKMPAGEIAKQSKTLSIGELELALLAQFPREDAEEWDRTGLLVGDPAALVTGVAVALDVTGDAIAATRRAGANVLLTHHPAFLDPPSVFCPSHARAAAAGVNVYEAAVQGVALMNFHTALDVSVEATRLYPNLMNFDFERILIPLEHAADKGYAMLCSVRAADKPFKLAHLAARATSVFGQAPRVWGDFDARLERVVIVNGSAGDMVQASIDAKADCLVCGELRYHAALAASQAGLALVEVGHDVSEFPLCALLAQAAREAGVPSNGVSLVDQTANWRYPDATRV